MLMCRAVSCALIAALLGTGLTGCVTSGSAGSAPADTPIRTVAFTDGGQIMTTVPSGDRATFAATPERMLRAVEGAYRDIGVEPTTVNVETRQVGNSAFVRRRQLGSVPLSRYFDCGNTFIGLRADDDRLTITMLSTITDAGGGKAEVRTVASAVAKPMDGTQTLPADCASSGRLEQLLRTAITKQLAAP